MSVNQKVLLKCNEELLQPTHDIKATLFGRCYDVKLVEITLQ